MAHLVGTTPRSGPAQGWGRPMRGDGGGERLCEGAETTEKKIAASWNNKNCNQGENISGSQVGMTVPAIKQFNCTI